MKLDDTALAAWTAAAVALGALLYRVIRWAAGLILSERKSDAAFGLALRDELWKEVGRLRDQVDVVRTRSDECDDRALTCQEENTLLARRVSILEASRS